MISVKRTTATAAAVAALAATATITTSSSASADSMVSIGKLWTSTHVPPHVRAGSTVEFHTWFGWHAYRKTNHELAVMGADFSLWNPRTHSCRGVSVSFFNPLTHKWQAGHYVGACAYALNLAPEPGIWKIPAGYSAQQGIRVTFSKHAAAGAWNIVPEPSSGYGIINQAGQGQLEDVAFPNWPVYTIRVFR